MSLVTVAMNGRPICPSTDEILSTDRYGDRLLSGDETVADLRNSAISEGYTEIVEYADLWLTDKPLPYNKLPWTFEAVWEDPDVSMAEKCLLARIHRTAKYGSVNKWQEYVKWYYRPPSEPADTGRRQGFVGWKARELDRELG